jgi:hypothetical protein
MSTEYDKIKNSTRRFNDETAIKKQTKIAKTYGVPVKDPHRLAKHHALNCGNTNCVMCGNPRKTYNEVTQQEKRLFQDVEKITDKRSNGLSNDIKE